MGLVDQIPLQIAILPYIVTATKSLTAHADVLMHGELAKDFRDLVGSRDPILRERVLRRRCQISALKQYAAGCGPDFAGEQIEESRLSGSIWAYDGGDPVSAEGGGNAFEGDKSTMSLSDVLNRENGSAAHGYLIPAIAPQMPLGRNSTKRIVAAFAQASESVAF
jgi:hypothetical protein